MSSVDPSVEIVRRDRDESVVLGPGPVFVRLHAQVAKVFPELVDAIERFEPIPTAAGNSCAEWLRERGLNDPQESVPYLMLDSGELQGFYALSNGQAEFSRRSLDVHGLSSRRTQPAVLLTQIARDHRHQDVGEELITHAVGMARRAAQYSAAVALALDPFDEETSRMWQERFGFQESLANGPGSHLRRLVIPLFARANEV